MDSQFQAQALGHAPLAPGNTAKYWREQRYGGLECLAVSFRTHAYERHTHETYVIGGVIAGCERFELGGTEYAARAGDLCFVNPDMVHDGRPECGGYADRMIYPSPALLAELAADISGSTPRGTLTFPTAVVHDPELSAEFIQAHRALENIQAALHADEAMLQALGRILSRHTQLVPSQKPAGERRAVGRARDYLAANVTENVDLATLAGISGLSRSHLIRAFKQEIGLTPHAFLVDRRVRLARQLLLSGGMPVSVAAAAGFADQAHMTRAFKARIGITPGRFAKRG